MGLCGSKAPPAGDVTPVATASPPKPDPVPETPAAAPASSPAPAEPVAAAAPVEAAPAPAPAPVAAAPSPAPAPAPAPAAAPVSPRGQPTAVDGSVSPRNRGESMLRSPRGSVFVLASELFAEKKDYNPYAQVFLGENLVNENEFPGYDDLQRNHVSGGVYGRGKEPKVDPPAPSHKQMHISEGLAKVIRTNRDWNQEYQNLLDQIQPTTPASERLEATTQIHRLFNAFCKAAREIGRVIISEAPLPIHEKIIQPVDLIGGEKFVAHGILFRRCVDSKSIYGSEEAAMKTAGHDRRGMRSYINLNSDLRTPMMTVVDFRGYRLIAQCILPPLDKNSLKYGSIDGGKTVHRSDKLAPLMEAAGVRIGLKTHLTGLNKSDKNLVSICGPCDIEVHKIKDDKRPAGRFMITSTARVFPPAKPWLADRGVVIPADGSALRAVSLDPQDAAAVQNAIGASTPVQGVHFDTGAIVMFTNDGPVNDRASALVGEEIKGTAVWVRRRKGQHLHQVLRPEFVVAYASLPNGSLLSSDAFSAFGKENAKTLNGDAERATEHLLNTVIPKLAHDITNREIFVTNGRQLCDVMHERGVNIRYLPHIRAQIPANHTRERSLILTEMIARFCKNALRWRMRQVPSVEDKLIAQVVARYFSVIFGSSEASQFFWTVQLPIGLREKFGLVTDANEVAELPSDLRTQVDEIALFHSLQHRTGVTFSRDCNRKFSEDPAQYRVDVPFGPRDVVALSIQDKRVYWGRSHVLAAVEQKYAEKKVKEKWIHQEIAAIFGEESIETAESHFATASGLLTKEPVAGESRDMDLDTAWHHAEDGWRLVRERLADGDARIAVLYLRGRLLDAQGKFEEARAEFAKCMEAVTMAYGALTATESKDQSTMRGHPISLVLANRIAHCATKLGQTLDAALINEAAATLAAYCPPVSADGLQRAFGESEPDIILKIQAAQGDSSSVVDFIKAAHAKMVAAQTLEADQKSEAAQDAAWLTEVEKFKDISSTWKYAAFHDIPHARPAAASTAAAAPSPTATLPSSPTSPQFFFSEDSNETEVNPDEVSEELELPTTLVAASDDEKANFDTQSYWGHHPVGAYYKGRVTMQIHGPGTAETTTREQLVFLQAKEGDRVRVITLDLYDPPRNKEEQKAHRAELMTSPPQFGDVDGEDRLVVMRKLIKTTKHKNEAVHDTDGSTSRTTTTAWLPTDESSRRRLLHPIKVKRVTESVADGTITVQSEEKVIVPIEEVVVGEKKTLAFRTKKVITGSQLGTSEIVRSFQVPGGTVALHEVSQKGDTKVIRRQELLDFGVLSPEEQQKWLNQYS